MNEIAVVNEITFSTAVEQYTACTPPVQEGLVSSIFCRLALARSVMSLECLQQLKLQS